MSKPRVVHYLNQFFGGIGSEDQADQEPRLREGPVGPGQLLQRALGDEAEVAATVLCGDNFVNEHSDLASEQIAEYVTSLKPDLFVAGPAFNAGRYGVGCGIAATAVQQTLKAPAITGMYPDNPAVELYRKQLYIVPTAATAIGMGAAISRMASLGLKLARGERLGLPADEGYLARGLRFTERMPRPAAERAVDM
ncbi:MAG: glycine/betaine/sarcosine/D-proline family reductase selenoprotein B, partial [Chloroflexota bacterium]